MSAAERVLARQIQNEVDRLRVVIENEADAARAAIAGAAERIEQLRARFGEDFADEIAEAAAKCRERLMKHSSTLKGWTP